jgi:hypothetical protein
LKELQTTEDLIKDTKHHNASLVRLAETHNTEVDGLLQSLRDFGSALEARASPPTPTTTAQQHIQIAASANEDDNALVEAMLSSEA